MYASHFFHFKEVSTKVPASNVKTDAPLAGSVAELNEDVDEGIKIYFEWS